MASTHVWPRRLSTHLDAMARDCHFHVAGLLHDHCWHRRLSWPINNMQKCLDCAGCWRYDWVRMRRAGRIIERQPGARSRVK